MRVFLFNFWTLEIANCSSCSLADFRGDGSREFDDPLNAAALHFMPFRFWRLALRSCSSPFYLRKIKFQFFFLCYTHPVLRLTLKWYKRNNKATSTPNGWVTTNHKKGLTYNLKKREIEVNINNMRTVGGMRKGGEKRKKKERTIVVRFCKICENFYACIIIIILFCCKIYH